MWLRLLPDAPWGRFVSVAAAHPAAAGLPTLLDTRGVMRELGITRAAAEAFMRRCPKVQVDGLRKVYVTRADLERVVNESTRPA